jgi:hypothetical protein
MEPDNETPGEAPHRHVDSEEEAQNPDPGEILVSPSGNVVIGLPTATAGASAPPPGSEG